MLTPPSFISNREIARVLFQMAALLEMMEANPFRVRAYRRGALAVLFLPRPLVEYYAADEQAPLPGVGERLRGHLAELVNTGQMSTHAALLDEVGEPLLSLLSVEGIGPRRALRLVQELRITSLDDLAEAARAGQVQTLPGFGPRLEAQIVAATERRLQAA